MNPIPGHAPGIELLDTLSPYVRHCGDSIRGEWSLGARRLLDYLLVYVAEGSGRFVVAETVYEAEEGDLYWVPPDTVTEMSGYPPSMHIPYVHFDLVYRPAVSHWDFSIPEGMIELGELTSLMHPPVDHPLITGLCGRIDGYNNQRIGALIIAVCAEASRAQPYNGICLSGRMLEIVAEILRGREGVRSDYGEHVPVLEEAAQYLRKHCCEELSIEEVAESCRLSSSYFRKLFRTHYSVSPRAYARLARIGLAKQLMMSSSMNLSEIAQETGFATVHSFSRAFRAVEGVTPSRYRSSGRPSTRVEGRLDAYPR